ncbi:MAG TPA: SET domain-containing protein-lysine N-methyltransferase [Burkholderiales bacterium]|jgi:SET domain-containing protein|nr:SET domain-containing protein-lysine N-methyltransferase [Burkholderiales bacterium]
MSAQTRKAGKTRKSIKSRKTTEARKSSSKRPIIVVRGSKIHGKGVFARRPIAKGERIIEYKGRLITEEEADKRYGDDESNHTFLFLLDNDMVIDAYRDGNSARWINHSCDPNCEPVEEKNRLYIHAVRNIKAGEELAYEYNLVIEDRYTPAIKKLYACRCGTRKCHGTFLAARR